MSDELEDRVQRVEYAIWGLKGNNGLVNVVKQLDAKFDRFLKEDAERRLKRAEVAEALAEERRRERFRNRLTLAGVLIAGAAATVGAYVQLFGGGA